MNNLSPTYYYNYESESVQNLVAEFRTDKLSDKEKAIGLYLKVRDGWWYNPYIISLKKEDYRASWLMEREHAPGVRRSGCPCCNPDDPANVLDKMMQL